MNSDSMDSSSSSVGAGESSESDQDLLRNTWRNNQIKIHSSASTNTSTLSAQSQVLGNLDLLQSIFVFFHSGVETVARIPMPDSKHLLLASLTCKTFFEPAMNVLWRAMDSCVPLLRLIPALTKEEKVYTMDGIIHEADLQRLSLYGRRTRRLDLLDRTHPVSPYIYTCLLQLSHSHLFPALRQLIIPDLADIADEDYPGLFLIPSSILIELSISSIEIHTGSIAASFLQNVYMKSPTLQKLVLTGYLTGSADLLNYVNRFVNLETLKIDCWYTELPGDTLEHFSKLPCLKTLRIGFDDDSSFVPPSSKPSFETLHDLDISASASQILVILRHMVLQCLKGIQVHITSLGNGASQASLGECVQQISIATTATQSLKTVWITSADASVVIPASELRWLVQAQTTHIDISVDLISCEMIGLLSPNSGLQTIEKLVLRSGRGNGKVLGIRTINLVGWLQSLGLFPNLKYLAVAITLRMNAPSLKAMRERLQVPTTCHELQELAFLPFNDSRKMLTVAGSATVENAFVLARYINHFCPHLRKLDFSKVIEIDSDWRKGVEVMVKGLQEKGETKHTCQDKK
ncbi:hypothetical protein GALMADRAFT_267409, partial [Galerina marginata CBS 339.88]